MYLYEFIYLQFNHKYNIIKTNTHITVLGNKIIHTVTERYFTGNTTSCILQLLQCPMYRYQV